MCKNLFTSLGQNIVLHLCLSKGRDKCCLVSPFQRVTHGNHIRMGHVSPSYWYVRGGHVSRLLSPLLLPPFPVAPPIFFFFRRQSLSLSLAHRRQSLSPLSALCHTPPSSSVCPPPPFFFASPSALSLPALHRSLSQIGLHFTILGKF